MEVRGGNIVSQIKYLSDRIFERILSEREIDAFNGAQGRILYVLWQGEHISLKELSDRTNLAATTLTGMVDRMEAAGLVCRVPDQSDRRKILLTLTNKARALKQDYMVVSDRMTQIFYAGFTEKEILQCEKLLCRIHGNLLRHDSFSAGSKKNLSCHDCSSGKTNNT